jgi:CheY-like chemotaxis protein
MIDGATILLAEDREDDILLITRAFEQGGIRYPILIVRDGEEAISYLSGLGRYSNRQLYPVPTLFLLDLTLPGTDGFEVLRWIRSRPELRDLPVVVLTQSDRIRDVNQAYQLGAYSFIVKTQDFHDAVAFAQSMSEYWLKLKTGSIEKAPTHWPAKENPLPYIQPPAEPTIFPSVIPPQPSAPPIQPDEPSGFSGTVVE